VIIAAGWVFQFIFFSCWRLQYCVSYMDFSDFWQAIPIFVICVLIVYCGQHVIHICYALAVV
jgi:hypothetical protein